LEGQAQSARPAIRRVALSYGVPESTNSSARGIPKLRLVSPGGQRNEDDEQDKKDAEKKREEGPK
jgi:hypothetical protein